MEEDRYVKEQKASDLTDIPLQTLRNLRCRGEGPSYVKFGRSVRYRVKDLIEFMESHRIETAPL
ncbi:MAG: helix-turn-helix domain-containing protein [Deltaproteobacteria bacterium]|jgi:hypothetical protein